MTIERHIKKNVSLKKYSTFGIGGEAELFYEITNYEDAQAIMRYSSHHNIPHIVIGKGSNTLFDDRGFKGLVIYNRLQSISFNDQVVKADSGYSFSLLGVKTALKGLGGLEFASGIPGSVGGAIFMNAGANNAETSNVLQSVGYINKEGQLHVLEKKDLKFSYRKSLFHELEGFIAFGTFHLKKCEKARKTQLDIIKYRTSTQPYKDLSIGCIFRNPKDNSAGALIEQCGLKGFAHKGAAVSNMHANFIVNKESAKASDVLNLIEIIKKQVKSKKGIELREEIRYIPYDYLEK